MSHQYDVIAGTGPVLIAVPHAGRDYPADVLHNMREPDEACLRLEDRHVDQIAREIAAATGASAIIANTPRAVIDLNRAADDVDWSMIAGGAPGRVRHSLANRRARSGLGLVPRRLPGMGEIWRKRLDRSELDRRIAQIHTPYHAALGRSLDQIRDRWGVALLVDLHSMPPLEPSSEEGRSVEFVLGDRFGASCAARLSALTMAYFDAHGRRAGHNRPYSGGYVLDRHSAPRRGIHAMQMEICRATYLCSGLKEPSARLPAVARVLAGLIRELAAECGMLGQFEQLPQAAE